jgi:hypothetical protein
VNLDRALVTEAPEADSRRGAYRYADVNVEFTFLDDGQDVFPLR